MKKQLKFTQDTREGKEDLYWLKDLPSTKYEATYTVCINRKEYSYKIWNNTRKRVVKQGKVKESTKLKDKSLFRFVRVSLLNFGVPLPTRIDKSVYVVDDNKESYV